MTDPETERMRAGTPLTEAFLNGRLPCSGLEGELIDFARDLERALAAKTAEVEEERKRAIHGVLAAQARDRFRSEVIELRAKNAQLEKELAAARAELAVIHRHDNAGLYFAAKLHVRDVWDKHLGPHKCAVDGVDQFLSALEQWMMDEGNPAVKAPADSTTQS